jgi:putative NADPH-quinone reductase
MSLRLVHHKHMTRILVIDAHPDQSSLCSALASSYAGAARRNGHDVSVQSLRELSFDPLLRHGYKKPQPLEPALVDAQERITSAEHLVFAYPTWWGAPPALLKGFLDRVLLPGFAFKFHASGTRWDKLLAGRTARLLVTMDFPAWYYRWLVGAPGDKAMAKSTLGFCGIAPVRISHFGTVRGSSPAQRERWLRDVATLGGRAV